MGGRRGGRRGKKGAGNLAFFDFNLSSLRFENISHASHGQPTVSFCTLASFYPSWNELAHTIPLDRFHGLPTSKSSLFKLPMRLATHASQVAAKKIRERKASEAYHLISFPPKNVDERHETGTPMSKGRRAFRQRFSPSKGSCRKHDVKLIDDRCIIHTPYPSIHPSIESQNVY